MLCPDDISIYIPSSGRPSMASRMLSERLPMATMVVAEDEVDAYLECGVPHDKILPHPNLYGLSRIRNFIVKNSTTEVTVQVDDDMHSLVCNVGKRRRVIHDPEMLKQVFFSTALTASEAGVNLFGYGNVTRPLYVKPDRPFHFTRIIGGVSGAIGKDVKWDEALVSVSDIDATLRELELRRIVWVDMRYAFHFGMMFQNPGGLQKIRSKTNRESDIDHLETKWGKFIDCRSIGGKTDADSSVYKILVKRS